MIAAPAARAVVACLGACLAACGARQSTGSSAGTHALEVGRPGAALTGVAGDGATVYIALSAAAPGRPTATSSISPTAAPPATMTDVAVASTTTIEAIQVARGASPVWQAQLDGHGGPLATSGGFVFAALGGTGSAAGLELRGEPGAAVVALGAATGAIAWKLAVDATEWVVIASLAATPDGVLVGGSFSGTLRIGASVVSSAGRADGFVARLTGAGGVAWLVRFGGPGADAVQGVAAAGDRIAIAGTFAAGAELTGQTLPPYDERSLNSDGFVAELDGAGKMRWAQTFGGKPDDTVAGVALDARGRIAVAATVRDTVHVGASDLVASGPADGMVAWWVPGGVAGAAVLIGGADFDGLRAIAAVGDHVVVAGFYSGALRLGDRSLTAAGGDDAFLAELDASGAVVEAWPVGGEGREEVTALAAIPGGFVAGIAHTADARLGAESLPPPRDPMGGAAILVRSVR